MSPLNGADLWEPSGIEKLLAPEVKKLPGRPKKQRVKAPHEEHKLGASGKLSRKGIEMTCQNCFQIGHNRLTCKNEIVSRPKKKRGRLEVEGGSSTCYVRGRGRAASGQRASLRCASSRGYGRGRGRPPGTWRGRGRKQGFGLYFDNNGDSYISSGGQHIRVSEVFYITFVVTTLVFTF